MGLTSAGYWEPADWPPDWKNPSHIWRGPTDTVAEYGGSSVKPPPRRCPSDYPLWRRTVGEPRKSRVSLYTEYPLSIFPDGRDVAAISKEVKFNGPQRESETGVHPH